MLDINKFITEFNNLPSWEDKYEKIIEIGKQLPNLEEKYKKEENKVLGCSSRVWLIANLVDEKLVFSGDSDSLIVKGLLAIILATYSNKKPLEILETKPIFLEKTDLTSHLSPTRNNGTLAILKKIILIANDFTQKIKKI